MLRQAHLVWGFVLVEEERLASCSLDAVASAMEQMAAVQMAALVGMLDLLGEYERREGWRVDSFGSMVDWVAARFSVSRETAAAWTATAGRLRELPRIHEVAAAGGLSWDQLRPLAELATPDTDAMWAEEGPGLSPARLRLLARRARPITKREEADAHEQRGLRMRWRRDGMFALSGLLPSDGGALVRKTIGMLAERDDALGPEGQRDSWLHRCADALVGLASGRAAQDADAARATIVVHAPVDVLAGEVGNGDLEDGPSLYPDTVRRLSCDARMRWILYGGNGESTELTEARATIPPWIRQLVKARDLTCRFPGCERRYWGQVHHVVWRSRNGKTKLDCLSLLCHEHHRAVHEGGWIVEGDADVELTFTSPAGNRFTSRPAGLRRSTADRLFGPQWPARPPPDAN